MAAAISIRAMAAGRGLVPGQAAVADITTLGID